MAKKKKAVKKAAHNTGVCAYGRELIRAGKTNAQVLAAIQKKFPTSQLKIGGVGWIRNDLRKQGEKVKTNAEAVGKKAA